MCSVTICLSSLWMCLVRPLTVINEVVFLFLSCKGSFSILSNSPLLDLSFANIFSQSVGFFLILLTFTFSDPKFLILLNLRIILLNNNFIELTNFCFHVSCV